LAAAYLDTLFQVETPEGVILELRPAGPVARLAAWLIDALLQLAVFGVLSGAVAALRLGAVGTGLEFLLLFVTLWFTPVAFELLRDGVTPGKAALGLQVLRADGLPVDAAASLIRNLLRVVDMLPVAPVAALVAMLATPGFRRIGDLAAGTLVVYRASGVPVWRAEARAGLAAAAPAAALTPAEQRTVVRFAERAPFLGEARARELAAPVAPLVGGRAEARNDPVASLAAVAAWITGRRGGQA
jgi:uncharacterized RDD family membrane protein YckC